MRSNKEVAGILLDFFDHGNKWTKGYFARDANDKYVDEDDPNACRFCLFGAIMKLSHTGQITHKEQDKFVSEIAKIIQTTEKVNTIARWNDHPTRTFADVESFLKGI